MGTSTTTGDGGMTPEERGHSSMLVYQYLPSRYGMNPDDLRKADAIEVVVGQGAKPGGGGMLLGQKISDRVADMRTLPKGIDQRSACRHPDWTGPDDLRKADAIEIVVGQGAKPGGGGMLLGQKISDRVAEMRTLPKGVDQRSACRHPDWTGPDDMEIKILELREITN